MKHLIAVLLLLPLLAFGAANDIVTSQRNSTDTSSIPRTVTKPPGAQDGLMGFNGSTVLPVHWTIGQGLTISAGALVALPQAWSDITGKPTFAMVATSGLYGDLAGIPGTFTPAAHTHSAVDIVSGTLATARLPALSISQTTGLQSVLDSKLAIPTGTSTQYMRGDGSLAAFPAIPGGTVASITAGTGLSGGTITTTGTISMPNTGTAGSYANVTTDAQGRVTAGTSRSQVAATRSLNTVFQVSASRDAWVSYSVQITVTASIAGGHNGDVVLEIASDSGFTANVQTIAISGLGQTYTLAIALQGIQPQTGVVTGYVPSGYYARLRTVNITGAPSFTYRAGQEVLQ
ncbi:hypothetical protein BK645_09865 [Pseudomonas protegens]|uniref:hypothetical protein n=1 Tax=Pseudomonas protegens TaxID=380021 RepID=UPI0002E21D63|nr:hypothetical protein [Pseudomonas protegens]ROM29266.1 hypothetical protein BK645_09865 [Pseudomonas protegens]ROM36898.1 hypothetical protein BK646_17905 [Pseudomonas protegens]